LDIHVIGLMTYLLAEEKILRPPSANLLGIVSPPVKESEKIGWSSYGYTVQRRGMVCMGGLEELTVYRGE
jgi:hypothetical protein